MAFVHDQGDMAGVQQNWDLSSDSRFQTLVSQLPQLSPSHSRGCLTLRAMAPHHMFHLVMACGAD